MLNPSSKRQIQNKQFANEISTLFERCYRIKSEEIRKKWNVEEMIDDIQNYQLKWNQHVLRMLENSLPRKALQYWPQGKIYLGRPYVVGKTSSCSCRVGIWPMTANGRRRFIYLVKWRVCYVEDSSRSCILLNRLNTFPRYITGRWVYFAPWKKKKKKKKVNIDNSPTVKDNKGKFKKKKKKMMMNAHSTFRSAICEKFAKYCH